MKINDIITDETGSVYAETAIWCKENNAMLEEIESKEGRRRFKIVSVPEPTAAEKQEQVRLIRNKYLADTDKYMISDFPITEEERTQYRAYRKYLRDYTKTDGWFEKAPAMFEKWKENT